MRLRGVEWLGKEAAARRPRPPPAPAARARQLLNPSAGWAARRCTRERREWPAVGTLEARRQAPDPLGAQQMLGKSSDM